LSTLEAGRERNALLRKADEPLRRAVERRQPSATAGWPVIVILEAPSGEAPSTPRARAARFDAHTRALVGTVRELGADDVRTNWLTNSLAMRCGLPALQVIAAMPEVRQLVLDSARQVMTSNEQEGEEAEGDTDV
jgi:hypothetical protein